MHPGIQGLHQDSQPGGHLADRGGNAKHTTEVVLTRTVAVDSGVLGGKDRQR